MLGTTAQRLQLFFGKMGIDSDHGVYKIHTMGNDVNAEKITYYYVAERWLDRWWLVSQHTTLAEAEQGRMEATLEHTGRDHHVLRLHGLSLKGFCIPDRNDIPYRYPELMTVDDMKVAEIDPTGD